jgi:DNA-binding LytR/AlgR family response regulator
MRCGALDPLGDPVRILLAHCAISPGTFRLHEACLRDGDCASGNCWGCDAIGCDTSPAPGGACRQDEDCAPTTPLCIDGICVAESAGAAGAPCSRDEQCNGACANGVCVDFIRQGACGDDAQCDTSNGSICATKGDRTCDTIGVVSEGAACTTFGTAVADAIDGTKGIFICDAASTCDGSICVALPGPGEPCRTVTNEDDGDFRCRKDLTCTHGACERVGVFGQPDSCSTPQRLLRGRERRAWRERACYFRGVKVLIVDDEPLARERLARILARIDGVACVGEAANGEDALAQIATLSPDVLLLDVEMPGMDGMALARTPGIPPVIFTTAHVSFAADAFDADAVDFVTKPVRQERLERALSKVRRRESSAKPPSSKVAAPDRIAVHDGKTVRFVDPKRVVAFRALDKYTEIRLDGEELLIRESLDTLERRLVDLGFLRVHRAALVREDAIVKLGDGEGALVASLTDGTTVEVSRRNAPELRRRLGLRKPR